MCLSKAASGIGYDVSMSLAKLEIVQFRNIKSASLEFDRRINLIAGNNASGKTSLLEAIYLIGRGRSFRSRQFSDLITRGKESLSVRARIEYGGATLPVTVAVRGSHKEIKLNGRPLESRAELLQAFPLQLIRPEFFDLLEGSPKARRQFLDWGIFYSAAQYLPTWRRYQRALAQRNSLLKSGAGDTLPFWTQELVNCGKIISQYRTQYLAELQQELCLCAQQLALGEPLLLRYIQGWAAAKSLETALSDDLARDQKYGFTHSGPHRDDFMVYFGEQPVRNFFSRGQMKLLISALALAQARLLKTPGVIMVDDLGAELDPKNQALLLDLFVNLAGQFFITTTNLQSLDGWFQGAGRVFHIDRGVISSA